MFVLFVKYVDAICVNVASLRKRVKLQSKLKGGQI